MNFSLKKNETIAPVQRTPMIHYFQCRSGQCEWFQYSGMTTLVKNNFNLFYLYIKQIM